MDLFPANDSRPRPMSISSESDGEIDNRPTFSTVQTTARTPTTREALVSFLLDLTLANRRVIETIVSTLDSLPDNHSCDLNALFRPAFENENLLRSVFPLAKRQGVEIPDPHIGLLKVFHLTSNTRRTQHPQDPPSFYRIASSTHSWQLPEDRIAPLSPELRRPHGSPTFVSNIEQFRHHLDIFSDGVISSIKNWSNIAIAGGSVLACVSAFPSKLSDRELNKLFHSDAYINADIDIFLYGLAADEAKTRMEEIFHEIDSASRWDVVCVRKRNTISIHTTWPKRTIQIILRLYQSIAEILAGFDVDSSCFAYDGKDVHATIRGFSAATRQTNTIDLLRRSPSYEIRLVKYCVRGFEILVLDLDRGRVDYATLIRNRYRAHWPRGLAFLLQFELVMMTPHYFYILSWPPRRRAERVRPDSDPQAGNGDEMLLENSNYDSVYFKIHYGRDVDAAKVAHDVRYLDTQMNTEFNMVNDGRRLHRHAVFCGTMRECLGDFCPECPQPMTAAERALVASETNFIRGPVEFIEDDPGRQSIGSFNPINAEGWFLEAYSGNFR